MAERPVEFTKLFSQGLRSDARGKRDLGFAETFKMMLATEFGAVEHTLLQDPFTAIEYFNLFIDEGHLEPFPFPQFFKGKGVTLLVEDISVGIVDESTWTVVRQTTFDLYTPANSLAITPGGGSWHFVDFHTTWFLFNDLNVIVKSQVVDPTKIFVMNNLTMRAAAAYKGRMLTGGYDSTNYWTAEANAWSVAVNRWFANIQSWGDPGWPTVSGGPGKNWIGWSSIGGGDLLFPWLPNSWAREGNPDYQVDLNVENVIFNGTFDLDPRKAVNGGWNVGEFGVEWVWDQANQRLSHPSGATGTRLQQLNSDYLRPSLRPNKEYDVTWTVNGDGATQFRIVLGTAAGPTVTPVGTQTYTHTIISLDAIATVHTLVEVLTVVGAGIWVDSISIVPTSPTTTQAHNEGDISLLLFPNLDPINNPLYMDYFREGQAGFMPMDWQGQVLNIQPFHKNIMVYGEDGISAIHPHLIDSGEYSVPTFGLEEHIMKVGLASKNAVTGDLDEQTFMDTNGDLWSIAEDLKPKRWGHKEFLQPMVGNDILMNMDSREKEVYIADGTDSWVFNKGSLSQHPYHVTAVFNVDGVAMGLDRGRVTNSEDVEILTNITDFGYRGRKHFGFIELDLDGLQDIRVTAKYRYDESSAFVETTDIYGSPDGVFHLGLQATEIQFKIKGKINRESISATDRTMAVGFNWTEPGNWSVVAPPGESRALAHNGAEDGTLATLAATDLTNAIISGRTYLAAYDFTLINQNPTARIIVGGVAGATRSVSGRYYEEIIAGSTGLIEFDAVVAIAGDTFYIDNVSVIEVGGHIRRLEVTMDYLDNRSKRSPRIKDFSQV